MKILTVLCALATVSHLYAQMGRPLELECTDARVVKSEIRSMSDEDPGRLITTPVNQLGEHIPGLTTHDFRITKGRKVAKILDVKELTAMENTIMRVIFMVDNSQSMSPHLAVLRRTLEKVISGFSPAVRVSVIFFNEQKQAQPPFDYNGKPLSLVRLPYTNDKQRAVTYTKNILAERLLTRNTYLYDGVYGGIQQIMADTGKVDRSFAIVFSDGKDNASTLDPETVLRMKKMNTLFFTIDYLTDRNDFLVSLAKTTGGEHFEAKSADELTRIFDQIAKKIVATGYEVAYRFKGPPTAGISASTQTLVMEEDIVRETFPLLNYVFFDQGSSVLPDRYVQLSAEQVADFDESGVEGGAMDFYHNVLNVIGSRLKASPGSSITVTGYLNDFGNEKRNAVLAGDRARTVQNYLRTAWGIDESRLKMATGFVPPVPSTSKEEEGRAENRRVEITSDDWDILKPVTFVRREASVNPEKVFFSIDAQVPEGLEEWVLQTVQNGSVFDERRGTHLEQKMTWNWKNKRGEVPASSGNLHYSLKILDQAGDSFTTPEGNIAVSEVRRERNLNVTTEGGITKEKISLILFPFDVAKPGAKNERIMETYVYPRLSEGARLTVTGYTDMIGSEEYNLRLSQNRADETLAILKTAIGGRILEGDMISIGVGETSPVFSNKTPEGRFYNRTVSLLIEKNPVR